MALQRLKEGRLRYKHYLNPSYNNFEGNFLLAIDRLIGTIEHVEFDPNALKRFIEHIKKEDTASSDIDLMLVSDTLTFGDTILALQAATELLGREVNPNIFTPKDFAKRLKEGGSFVSRVMAQPKVWLMGEEHDLSL